MSGLTGMYLAGSNAPKPTMTLRSAASQRRRRPPDVDLRADSGLHGPADEFGATLAGFCDAGRRASVTSPSDATRLHRAR